MRATKKSDQKDMMLIKNALNTHGPHEIAVIQ